MKKLNYYIHEGCSRVAYGWQYLSGYRQSYKIFKLCANDIVHIYAPIFCTILGITFLILLLL